MSNERRLIDPENLPVGDEKKAAVQSMFDAIAPNYDLANRILTFRMDVRWRRLAVDRLVIGKGDVVVDLAAGTGDLCFELQKRGARAIGVDLSHGMLANAPKPFEAVQADATQLPLTSASVDGATCGFALRNFVDLEGFLNELGRVVKPGGRISLLEVAEPPNPVVRAGHSFYFTKVVPLVGGLISDADAYRYLPKSVAYLPPTDELLALVESAGFERVERTLLSGGISQLICATRATAAS